jgi:hypothetical protein
MDPTRKSSPTYAEMVARSSPIPRMEEGIGVANKEYHPWLLKHIPKPLIDRNILTKIETGYQLGNQTDQMPASFSFKKIFPLIQVQEKDKKILERRIYRLSLSSLGMQFLTYLNTLSPALSIRKFEKFIQIIVDSQAAIYEEKLPLEWISLEKRKKLDQILAPIARGDGVIRVSKKHPQKEKILKSIQRLSMRPVGQDLLEKLESSFPQTACVEVYYEKNEFSADSSLNGKGNVCLWIDTEDECGNPVTIDAKGEFIESNWKQESSIGHELLHALNTFFRDTTKVTEKKAFKKKMIQEVNFSPVLGRYMKEDLPDYYEGLSMLEKIEEQIVILGALEKGVQKYSITENAIRFCFFDDLRITHNFFDSSTHKGRIFEPYKVAHYPFEFFGEMLCDDLHAAILKVDKVAFPILLGRLNREEIRVSLEPIIEEIRTLSIPQRAALYEVVEEVFKKYKPTRCFLSRLPFTSAARLVQSDSVDVEDLKRCCQLLNYKGFSLRIIAEMKGTLKKLQTLLPFYSPEQRRVGKLLYLAGKY